MIGTRYKAWRTISNRPFRQLLGLVSLNSFCCQLVKYLKFVSLDWIGDWFCSINHSFQDKGFELILVYFLDVLYGFNFFHEHDVFCVNCKQVITILFNQFFYLTDKILNILQEGILN